MVYLLEHRWQGACIASALAEHVVQSGLRSASPQEALSVTTLAPARRIALAIAQDLVQAGRVNPDGYAYHWPEGTTLSPAATAIATLPLILFCHEVPAQLDQVLRSTLTGPHCSPALQDSTRTIARAIAALLVATPLTALLPELLHSQHSSPKSHLLSVLEQVQTLLDRRASLHTAIAELTHDHSSDIDSLDITTVGLAFYCLLSTPNELGLAMQRAARCPDALQVVALTGALAGAQHTQWGIPLTWQVSQPSEPDVEWPASQWMPTIQRLFATWAGVSQVDPLWTATIASPQSPFRR